VLDGDLVAEEGRRPGAGVRDQCLVLVEFQLEVVMQERCEALLDLLGFGSGSGEPEEVIICLCGLPDYADGAPGTWVCTGDCGGVVVIILGLSR
jgi:hypothetical protein